MAPMHFFSSSDMRSGERRHWTPCPGSTQFETEPDKPFHGRYLFFPVEPAWRARSLFDHTARVHFHLMQHEAI